MKKVTIEIDEKTAESFYALMYCVSEHQAAGMQIPKDIVEDENLWKLEKLIAVQLKEIRLERKKKKTNLLERIKLKFL